MRQRRSSTRTPTERPHVDGAEGSEAERPAATEPVAERVGNPAPVELVLTDARHAGRRRRSARCDVSKGLCQADRSEPSDNRTVVIAKLSMSASRERTLSAARIKAASVGPALRRVGSWPCSRAGPIATSDTSEVPRRLAATPRTTKARGASRLRRWSFALTRDDWLESCGGAAGSLAGECDDASGGAASERGPWSARSAVAGPAVARVR